MQRNYQTTNNPFSHKASKYRATYKKYPPSNSTEPPKAILPPQKKLSLIQRMFSQQSRNKRKPHLFKALMLISEQRMTRKITPKCNVSTRTCTKSIVMLLSKSVVKFGPPCTLYEVCGYVGMSSNVSGYSYSCVEPN